MDKLDCAIAGKNCSYETMGTNGYYLEDWTPAIKFTESNMKCQDQQYEMGKIFQHPGAVEVCSSGYHVAGDIVSGMTFYETFDAEYDETVVPEFICKWNTDGHRSFNVSIKGRVDFGVDGNKISAEYIRFDSEIDLTNGTFKNDKLTVIVENNKIVSVTFPEMTVYFTDDRATSMMVHDPSFTTKVNGTTCGYTTNVLLTDSWIARVAYKMFYGMCPRVAAKDILAKIKRNGEKFPFELNLIDIIPQHLTHQHIRNYGSPQQYIILQPYAPVYYVPAPVQYYNPVPNGYWY